MTERYTVHVPVRWSDMDAYGHVNNARFLTLYEEARVALLFFDARKAGIDDFEKGTIIARQEVDYLRPVDFDDEIRIEMWVAELRNASYTICYELFANGVVASRAKTVCVPYDLAATAPRRISPAEREYLLPYLAS